MADGENSNGNDGAAGAEPGNPAQARSPQEIKEQLDELQLQKLEKENNDKEAAQRALFIRLQFFSKQFGAKKDPDPRTMHLIGGVDMQDKNMVTFMADGKLAIKDTGNGIRMTSIQFNDDAAQVLASQILAKEWGEVKVAGWPENRFKLAAALLSLDPDVKLKGIKVNQELLDYAQMLRKSRGLTPQQGQTPQQPAPPSPDNNTPTADFPVAGEIQREFETILEERASALEDIRRDRELRNLEPNHHQLMLQSAVNNVLDGVQKASDQEIPAYRQMIEATLPTLRNCDAQQFSSIIFQASKFVDQVRDASTQQDFEQGSNAAPRNARRAGPQSGATP